MKKIVINSSHCSFELSPLAVKELCKLTNQECYFFVDKKLVDVHECYDTYFWDAFHVPNPDFKKMETRDSNGFYLTANKYADSIMFSSRNVDRCSPHLISVVETLGDKANGSYSKLKIVEIPEDVEYTIENIGGCEWVAEVHRTWD